MCIRDRLIWTGFGRRRPPERIPGPVDVYKRQMVRYPMKRFRENVVGSFDVAIPVVHGTNVEDGTLMGFLEMLGVPYASCDVTASAVGMDKYLMKAAMKQAGLPVLDALQFTGKAYALDSDCLLYTSRCV